MKLGDRVAILAILVWLSVAAGPAWVGMTILAGALALNQMHDTWRKR